MWKTPFPRLSRNLYISNVSSAKAIILSPLTQIPSNLSCRCLSNSSIKTKNKIGESPGYGFCLSQFISSTTVGTPTLSNASHSGRWSRLSNAFNYCLAVQKFSTRARAPSCWCYILVLKSKEILLFNKSFTLFCKNDK